MMMSGLCHICYCSNKELFFSKKNGMTVCATCATDQHYNQINGEKK